MPKRVACSRALVHYEPDSLHPHVDCDWVATAEGVEHVLAALERHTLDAHQIDTRDLPPSLRRRVLEAVEDAD